MAGADLGVDTGGTFTDFVTADGRVLKLPSDARSPGRVFEEGAAALFGDGGARERLSIAHGTTVATNALLTGRLASVGVLMTRGFRDLLEIGRQNRPDIYALEVRRAWTPPPREMCAEVTERLDASGRVVIALDEEDVLRAGRRLVRRGARAFAVCFLHSYRDPRHERVAARLLAGFGLPVTTSSGLVPEFREFERFSTALANAQLMPLLAEYRANLDERRERLRRAVRSRTRPRISIIRSDGGVAGIAEAAREPVRLVLSGPAAGIVGARAAAASRSRRKLMTLDMGGTSTDVALVDGELPIVPRGEIAGRPLLVPSLDIHTVGAGGGSIAERGSGGGLRVGPASAGARPGPACYGHGGPATVTDANLYLGRIPATELLGGAFALSRDASGAAIADLARALDLDPVVTAEGIVRVAEATMERALRRISLERGHDPRDFTLVAFGGAGGLHAAALAEALGITEVVIPPHPGLLSATGMLHARVRTERSRGLVDLPLERFLETPERWLDRLERDGFKAMKRDGVDVADIDVETFADLRYRGQSHELTVPIVARQDLRAAFDRAHEKRYGFAMTDRGVEVVAVRKRLAGPPGRLPRVRVRVTRDAAAPASRSRARIDGRWRHVPVYRRGELTSGPVIAGPLIVTEYSSTIVVPSGWTMGVEKNGNLLLGRTP